MAETKTSAKAEVLEKFYPEIDMNTCLHRQVSSADYYVFDDKWRKS